MKTIKPTGSAIRTFTGIMFDFAEPSTISVNIIDIAHALSNLCRFAGHVRSFYSVGEHSVRVSYACPPEHAFWGLMHDCSEAYAVDVPRPLKYLAGMESYRVHEKAVQSVICDRFGMNRVEPEEVKDADNQLLATEQRDLIRNSMADFPVEPLPTKIKPWSPQKSERMFLARFHELRNDDLTMLDRVRLWMLRREVKNSGGNNEL